jgi:hypothetical protein
MSDDPRAYEIDLDAVEAMADAASPGPWHWSGNTKTRVLSLCTWISGQGRTSVMDFTRWGMSSARPRFNVDMFMTDADELAVWEVCREATDPNDPRLYRHDVVDIRHPDAQFIATMSPALVKALVARVRQAEADRDRYRLEQASA